MQEGEEEEKGEEEQGAAAVLVGDMNTEPGSRSIELLLESSPGSFAFTFSFSSPLHNLMFGCTSGDGRASFVDAWVTLHPTANHPDASPADRGTKLPPPPKIDSSRACSCCGPRRAEFPDVEAEEADRFHLGEAGEASGAGGGGAGRAVDGQHHTRPREARPAQGGLLRPPRRVGPPRPPALLLLLPITIVIVAIIVIVALFGATAATSSGQR